ncbi:hypothetical protein H8959_007392 [Pygathrix nigripes]
MPRLLSAGHSVFPRVVAGPQAMTMGTSKPVPGQGVTVGERPVRGRAGQASSSVNTPTAGPAKLDLMSCHHRRAFSASDPHASPGHPGMELEPDSPSLNLGGGAAPGCNHDHCPEPAVAPPASPRASPARGLCLRTPRPARPSPRLFLRPGRVGLGAALDPDPGAGAERGSPGQAQPRAFGRGCGDRQRRAWGPRPSRRGSGRGRGGGGAAAQLGGLAAPGAEASAPAGSSLRGGARDSEREQGAERDPGPWRGSRKPCAGSLPLRLQLRSAPSARLGSRSLPRFCALPPRPVPAARLRPRQVPGLRLLPAEGGDWQWQAPLARAFGDPG